MRSLHSILQGGLSMDYESIARNVKNALKGIYRGLFVPEQQRHSFDEVLREEFYKVLTPYSAPGMDSDISMDVFFTSEGLPYIQIVVFLSDNSDPEKKLTLLKRLEAKFRRYLLIRNMSWPFFGTYTSMCDETHFFLYFGEFQTDLEPLNRLYRVCIKEKVGNDFGCLIDDDLEKEIKKYVN